MEKYLIIFKCGCRFTDENKGGVLIQDCEDDGENAAGGRLLHLLQVG